MREEAESRRFDALDALLCRDIETGGEFLNVFGDGQKQLVGSV